MAKPSTAPKTRPTSTPPQNETREIIHLAQSRKKIYPKMTLDNFDEYRYRELVDPLRANPKDLVKIQKDFLRNMDTVKDKLKDTVLREFSYAKAKESARSSTDKARFSQLDRQIGIVQASQSTSLANPNLELLFGAKDQTEFNKRLADTKIVQAPYAANSQFKARAQSVFNYILQYRARNSKTLKDETIDNYLNDIFSKGKDQIDNSTIINPNLLSASQKASVEHAYDQYHLYRKWLKRQFQLEKTVRKERETFLSKPVEYAKSGEHYVAEKIQKMRDHWAGMDGKEKFIAGLTILVGTAWFLNSDNAGMQKARNAMMKAGLIALGYVGVNTTSKVLFGKSLSHMAGSYVEDRSGGRDFLKDSFNTDKEGADNMQTSLAVLGNNDFIELSDLYLQEEAKYQRFHTPDNLRGIPVGGVAENEMTPHTIYFVMKLLDKKLRKNNSSIEKLNIELNKAAADAKRQGKEFVRPTWAMIVTAVLQNQKLGWGIDKKGRISVKAEKPIETKWENVDKNRTRMWWPLTGRPRNWKLHTVDNTPRENVNSSQLNKLSSTLISPNKPLRNLIRPENFGRYVRGFNALYVHGYSKEPTKAIHSFNYTGEHAQYMTSKVKVDTQTHRNKTNARIASVQSAYQQALKSIKDKIDKTANHPLKSVKDRLSEFVQPVFGTFIGKSKNSAKEYVMFLRIALPGSMEYDLRKAREWPEGNMMEQMHEKQLTTGDILTRADFKTLSKKKTVKLFRTSYPQIGDSAYAGAYESFLAKVRLNKEQISEIDKILDYYSKKFANGGMTKAGLVRYLATHNFTDKELKEALGLSASTMLPQAMDLYSAMKKITLEAPIKNPSAVNRAYIVNSLGNITVLACYKDKKALEALGHIDPTLKATAESYSKSTPVTMPAILPALITAYIGTIEKIYNTDTAAAKEKQKKVKTAAARYYQI